MATRIPKAAREALRHARDYAKLKLWQYETEGLPANHAMIQTPRRLIAEIDSALGFGPPYVHPESTVEQ